VARLLSSDAYAQVAAGDVANTLGLDERTVTAIGGALRDAGFVDGIAVDEIPGLIRFTTLTPAGRREMGLWPCRQVAADRLMVALEQAIERAEGEQKTRLQKIRDGFLSAGRDLIVDVASGVTTGQIGSWIGRRARASTPVECAVT